MSWSISVKTVGGGANPSSDDADQAVSKPKPTDFTVDVEPDDLVTSLYTQIEKITGLRKCQQRLIYRGRLLGEGPLGRIKDVDGLSDGQTIHLVPKRPEPVSVGPENGSSGTSAVESTLLQRSSDEGSETMVGSASAGILAALLGLGSSSSSNLNDGDTNDDDADVEHLFPLPLARSTRLPSHRRTTNVYRRFATDPRYPEPGPIEPVRQSLMTLHTMVESRPQNLDEIEQEQKIQTSAKRKWYKGQWLDCRDTVNQWLEATVVEIVDPNEILKSVNVSPNDKPNADTLCPSTDPAIGADDMEGRRKLLLESADDVFDKTLSDLNNDDKLIGYRERYNKNIQLMLVHYNGWPRRWDEWIRSDSERIRPFRTRSKHVSSQSHVCPTPNSAFENAPDTHITHENDKIDRLALLPELHRSLNSIQDFFGESLQREKDPLRVKTLTLEEQLDLATAVNKLQGNRLNKIRDMFDDSTAAAAKCDGENDIDLSHLNDQSQQKINRLLEEARVRVRSDNKRVAPDSQLPWATCEGDSKPKAYGDDASIAHETNNDYESINDLRLFNKKKLEALAPLLDRLGRVLIDAAPHVAAIAESLPDVKPVVESKIESSVEKHEDETAPRDVLAEQTNAENSTRLFSIQEETPPVSINSNATDNIPPLMRRSNSELSDNSTDEVNPDYVDFVNGFIHVARSESSARSGGMRRGGPNDGVIGASLFSALLASGNSDGGDDDDEDSRNIGGRSGPRVLRVGGSGGGGGSGGIDIHIHAIVTGGGGGGGGIAGIGLEGLGGLGGLLSPPPSAVVLNNPSASTESRADSPGENELPTIPQPNDEDDLGLFSDLYSDNPRPEDSRSITSSTTWSDDIEIPDEEEVEDEASDSPSLTAMMTTINDDNSNDARITILPISDLVRDSSVNTTASAPLSLSNTEPSISSSNRQQNESRGQNGRTVNQQPRSTPHEPRRSNSIRGLFRRVLTRRSSNNT